MRALLVVLLLLSGCAAAPHPTSATAPVAEPVRTPVYVLDIRITHGAPDGSAFPDAEVYGVPVGDSGLTPFALPTDKTGTVHLAYPEPFDLLVQAIAPGPGWTREGTRIHVGDSVTATGSARVDGRTVTFGLLPSSTSFTVHIPVTAPAPGADALAPHAWGVDVPLPGEPALRALYIARLSGAHLELAWTDGAGAAHDLYAGLAWDATLWVNGTDDLQPPVPGTYHETLQRTLPAEGRPMDADVPLRAVALARHPVVGATDVTVTGRLVLSGIVPAGLAPPPCWSAGQAPLPLPSGLC